MGSPDPKIDVARVDKTELDKALNLFAISYLRLGDLMTRTQSLLKGVRPAGRSGNQLLVLAADVEALQKSYNMSVPAFTENGLPPEGRAAVDALITQIRAPKNESLDSPETR